MSDDKGALRTTEDVLHPSSLPTSRATVLFDSFSARDLGAKDDSDGSGDLRREFHFSWMILEAWVSVIREAASGVGSFFRRWRDRWLTLLTLRFC